MSYENLFVTKLPRELTDADLITIFGKYKPQSAKVMLDASSGKSKGFGFVLFETPEAGYNAYKELNQAVVQYRAHSFPLVIYPSKHDGKIANKANRALYIRNIPLTVPQEDVVKFLRSFGNLSYYAMREGSHGNMVWVVYAEYETIEEAENALNLLHGSVQYFSGGVPLLAKFSDTEDAKKARRLRREQAREAAVPSPTIGTTTSAAWTDSPTPVATATISPSTSATSHCVQFSFAPSSPGTSAGGYTNSAFSSVSGTPTTTSTNTGVTFLVPHTPVATSIAVPTSPQTPGVSMMSTPLSPSFTQQQYILQSVFYTAASGGLGTNGFTSSVPIEASTQQPVQFVAPVVNPVPMMNRHVPYPLFIPQQ